MQNCTFFPSSNASQIATVFLIGIKNIAIRSQQQRKLRKVSMATSSWCKNCWEKTLIPFKSFKSTNNKQQLETFLRFTFAAAKFHEVLNVLWISIEIVNCKLQIWEHLLLKSLTWMIRVLTNLELRFDYISYWILYFKLFFFFFTPFTSKIPRVLEIPSLNAPRVIVELNP